MNLRMIFAIKKPVVRFYYKYTTVMFSVDHIVSKIAGVLILEHQYRRDEFANENKVASIKKQES